MDTVSVVVSIDRWKAGADDFADFIWSIIRDGTPDFANRIDVKVVKS